MSRPPRELTPANPEVRAALYFDLILISLSQAARDALEKLMPQYEYQSEFAKKYFAEGLEEGREQGQALGEARALIQVLAARHLAITPSQRKQIEGCADLAQLERWLARAVSVNSVDELLRE